MKRYIKAVFVIYLILLLWLVLFKTSLDIPSVLANYHMRKLSLIPFAGRMSEMVENIIIFLPFGLFLSAIFKRMSFWQKMIIVFLFSLAIETIQYVLAIGISDSTDVITNTLGGLFGLGIYIAGKRYMDERRTERFITICMMVLILLFLLLRFFVFKVRY